MLRRSWILGVPGLLAQSRPLFSFGVLADIQYADQDTWGAREYRKSIEKLEHCSTEFGRERLAFVIQLGDLVDGGLANLDRILPVYNRIAAPKHHALGNHDFCAERDVLLKRLGMSAAYYQFSQDRWRFVVLDGMNVSVAGGWRESEEPYREGRELLSALQKERTRNAQTWNGAVGRRQRSWLTEVLGRAVRQNERAIVFCHFPVLAAACRPEHLLWDHREVLAILEAHRCVAAYMCGHDHRGGYAEGNGIHHVTFAGMVEHSAGECCHVVDVYKDRLVVRGAGATAGQTLVL